MPSPDKIKAIRDMPPPTSVSELRTILGMLNYLGRFINNLATILKPMSDLLKLDTVWDWGRPQQNAFQKIKTHLTSLPTLAYYRTDRHTIVSADASSYGLGAVILQENRGVTQPKAFTS